MKCPFCGTEQSHEYLGKTYRATAPLFEDGKHRVVCRNGRCLAEGPPSTSASGAIRRWELRRSEGEILRRYQETMKLLRRTQRSARKDSWEEGETLDDVLLDIRHLLSQNKLEREIVESDGE